MWAEAFSIATYIHNRTPTKALDSRTPFETVYGALSAFDASCAIVELTERLRKLDDRAIICFFVGYKYEGGGYRVSDLKGELLSSAKI